MYRATRLARLAYLAPAIPVAIQSPTHVAEVSGGYFAGECITKGARHPLVIWDPENAISQQLLPVFVHIFYLDSLMYRQCGPSDSMLV